MGSPLISNGVQNSGDILLILPAVFADFDSEDFILNSELDNFLFWAEILDGRLQKRQPEFLAKRFVGQGVLGLQLFEQIHYIK